jgi:hypothetical protein
MDRLSTGLFFPSVRSITLFHLCHWTNQLKRAESPIASPAYEGIQKPTILTVPAMCGADAWFLWASTKTIRSALCRHQLLLRLRPHHSWLLRLRHIPSRNCAIPCFHHEGAEESCEEGCGGDQAPTLLRQERYCVGADGEKRGWRRAVVTITKPDGEDMKSSVSSSDPAHLRNAIPVVAAQEEPPLPPRPPAKWAGQAWVDACWRTHVVPRPPPNTLPSWVGSEAWTRE